MKITHQLLVCLSCRLVATVPSQTVRPSARKLIDLLLLHYVCLFVCLVFTLHFDATKLFDVALLLTSHSAVSHDVRGFTGHKNRTHQTVSN